MSSVPAWDAWLRDARLQRRRVALDRRLRLTEQPTAPRATRNGRTLINLSSNNYLGLADHPALVEAAQRGASVGTGAGSSPLIVGHNAVHQELEEQVAAFKGTEAALVFGSGYLANVGILAGVLDRDCVVLSDRLNHASIIDGVRLSRAERLIYRHNDLDHLEALLRQAAASGPKRALIVTDTVFSMDGDVAGLREIVDLKERYGAALMIDEAHGGGVFGPNGEGLAHEFGLGGSIDLNMGTFSKAFGVYGGYVAGSREWIDHLVSSCRTFIYSTALPPAVVSAISAALVLVESSGKLRRALHSNAERLRNDLFRLGLDTGPSTTQIVPVIVGESERALALGKALEDRGVLGVAIRPPTVPPHTARVRFSLMATHSEADLDHVLSAVEEAARILGAIDGP